MTRLPRLVAGLHLLFTLGWVASTFVSRRGRGGGALLPAGSGEEMDVAALIRDPGFLYLLALGSLVLLATNLLVMGRFELGRRGLVLRLPLLGLILLPPLAPMVFSLLCSGLMLRAGKRWTGNDEARADLFHLCHAWRRLGIGGVSMGVLWCWVFFEHLISGAGSWFPDLWRDPLVSMHMGFSILPRVGLLALAIFHGRLLLLTTRVFALHRRLWAASDDRMRRLGESVAEGRR